MDRGGSCDPSTHQGEAGLRCVAAEIAAMLIGRRRDGDLDEPGAPRCRNEPCGPLSLHLERENSNKVMDRGGVVGWWGVKGVRLEQVDGFACCDALM